MKFTLSSIYKVAEEVEVREKIDFYFCETNAYKIKNIRLKKSNVMEQVEFCRFEVMKNEIT